jgi:hypothetical protein
VVRASGIGSGHAAWAAAVDDAASVAAKAMEQPNTANKYERAIRIQADSCDDHEHAI